MQEMNVQPGIGVEKAKAKKAIALIGSPHGERSNTVALAGRFLEALARKCQGAGGFAHEVISLGKKHIEPCRGCWNCTRTGVCPIGDDLREIHAKLLAADLVILGTPVYVDHVSAQLKSFADRSFTWLHTLRLIGKPSLSILTTAGSGKIAVRKYLRKLLYLFGTIPLGHLAGIAYRPGEFPGLARLDGRIERLAGKAARVLTGRRRLRPRMLNGLYFLAMKLKAKFGAEWLPYEHGYWRERNWFSKSYRQAAELERTRRGAS